METRKEEMELRKLTKIENIKKISIKKDAIVIDFKKGVFFYGFMSVHLGAPASYSGYEITFKRNKSDAEIIQEDIEIYDREMYESEERFYNDLEDDIMEAYLDNLENEAELQMDSVD